MRQKTYQVVRKEGEQEAASMLSFFLLRAWAKAKVKVAKVRGKPYIIAVRAPIV